MDTSSSRPRIDLNADLGEGCPWDEPLLDRVTSASVSCGAHAGDEHSIRATLLAAKARGVAAGAHPGYPDRDGFGRRERDMSREEAEALILDQVAALKVFADEIGVPIRYVKPHGALYNQAQREDAIASGIVSACKTLGLPVLGLPGSVVEHLAFARGVRFVSEGFADRGYTPEGRLLARDRPGAFLALDQTVEQALRLVARGLDTICLHGDNAHSVEIADMVRAEFDRHGIKIHGFST
jgi:UPF0271 protein